MFERKIKQDVIIEPPKYEFIPHISIPLEEYKELLTYKGKYLGLWEVKQNENR